MADWDWGRIAVQVGTYVLSSAAGLGVGIWKWGRSSAKQEQSVKDDYTGKINALRDEVRTNMASHAQKVEDGHDLLVSQFKESFEGIRRQHDDHKMVVEKEFLRKEDFRDFREEYREDTREIKASIAQILRSN